jgi:C-methyltransferase C-terminal domain/Putative zinc binding domain/Methyltransferase domain
MSNSRPLCRFCNTSLIHEMVDLGMSPLCESILTAEQLNRMEPFYPLKVHVCSNCFLAQLEEYVSPEEIFTEYAYFSSYSDSWLQHARTYTNLMIERFNLGRQHQVVELASNDGYLLQYFLEHGIPVLGIEPAKNIAKVAIEKGIETITEFFGVSLAEQMVSKGVQADLLLGNNVLAQVPDVNDFVAGMKIVLKPKGIITIEFPHLMRLMEGNQFDTIYHEHFSYFSFLTAEKIFGAHGITLFDVEELKSHGGSLRIYGRHAEDRSKAITQRAISLKDRELESGYDRMETYATFAEKVKQTKRKLLQILTAVKQEGKTIVGYGAPGKGNTLLNYCGIRTDFLDYTVDRNPYKHGRFTPGTHIEIFHPDKIRHDRPDYVFILPWNLKDEIIRQMSFIKEWGGRFIVPIPEPEVIRDF